MAWARATAVGVRAGAPAQGGVGGVLDGQPGTQRRSTAISPGTGGEARAPVALSVAWGISEPATEESPGLPGLGGVILQAPRRAPVPQGAVVPRPAAAPESSAAEAAPRPPPPAPPPPPPFGSASPVGRPLLHTTSLLEMLTRYRDGDTAALDELLRRLGERLERLARQMLRGFPVVRQREQTDDVLNGALLRLTRALRAVRPSSTADFFGLAAEQIRRALLDLARYHRRRFGINQPLPGGPAGAVEVIDPHAADPRELERWQALHEAVERLPAELREAFGLTFYHGWTQEDMARLLGMSDRQVRRLWRRACLRLNELLGGDLPRP